MSRTAKVWTLPALLAHTDEVGDCLVWRGNMKGLNGGWPAVYAPSRPAREGDGERAGKTMVNVRWLVALLSGDARALAEFEGRLRRGMWGCSCEVTGCVAPAHIRRRTVAEHLTAQRKVVFASPVVNALRAERIARTVRRQRSKLPPEAVPGALALVAQVPQVEAARRLGVSRHAVGQLEARQRKWRPVVGGVFSGLGGRQA